MNESDGNKDLFAEIDALFGKSAQDALRTRKQANADYHARNSAATSTSAIIHGANTLARNWREQPGWKPECRITYVQLQTCEHCGNTAACIGNQLIKWRNDRLKATISTAEWRTHDEAGNDLPLKVERIPFTVQYCASCLSQIEDAQSHVCMDGWLVERGEQLSLDMARIGEETLQ